LNYRIINCLSTHNFVGIVRFVAINVVAHVQKTKCQSLVSLSATIIEDEVKLVAPFLPINRHQESSTNNSRLEKHVRREEEERLPREATLGNLCNNVFESYGS